MTAADLPSLLASSWHSAVATLWALPIAFIAEKLKLDSTSAMAVFLLALFVPLVFVAAVRGSSRSSRRD